MKYWLAKSEPNEYSWQMLVKDKLNVWTGVRNYRARNNLKLMKKGDLVFFYHSNIGKEIMGVMKVKNEAHPDPTIDDERWVAVDFVPVKELTKPVTLEDVKHDEFLQNMQLIKISRLSVQEVAEDEFNYILKLSKTKLA